MENKTCSRCNKTKSVSEFSRRTLRNGNIGYQAWCKQCNKEHCKDSYDNGSRKAQIRKRSKLHRKELGDAVAAIKLEHGCKVCGYSKNPAALEFHHSKDDKEKTVSQLVGRMVSFKRIMLEINKCEVLCCRCHRELHHPL